MSNDCKMKEWQGQTKTKKKSVFDFQKLPEMVKMNEFTLKTTFPYKKVKKENKRVKKTKEELREF